MREGLCVAWLWCVPLWCGVLACSSDASTIVRVRSGATAQLSVVPFEIGESNGISGAAATLDGNVWVVAERQHTLTLLGRAAGAWRVLRGPLAIDGVDATLELESLALLSDGTLLVGTETASARLSDQLLIVRVDGDAARVVQHVTVDYERVGLRMDENHGVEAACVADGVMVLGLEVRADDGTAPVVVHDTRDNTWRALSLRLSSSTGKLASFDCRAAARGGGLEVLAMERHYGVARVLVFDVTRAALAGRDKSVIEPRLLLDLAEHVEPLPNFESLVWLRDQLLLITDNHHGRVTGATQALRIRDLVVTTRP